MRPEAHLTGLPARADFVVDLSNVMKKVSLGGDRAIDLRRFLALIEALAEHSRDDEVKVCAIGDRSLIYRNNDMAPEDRETVLRWRRRGLVELLEWADPRVLELADAFPALCVVSDDNYDDFHRTYAWLPDNRDRFLEAVPGPAGVVKVRPRMIKVKPDWVLSRKEEESMLMGAGMYDRRGGTGARRALLTRVWRCPEAGCVRFGPDSGDEQPLPLFRNGVVRCPTHDTPLTDAGPSTPRIQIKLRVDGAVLARFIVRAGAETVVGRAPDDPAGIRLRRVWLSDAAARCISRNHVALSWNGTALTVRDLSRNGTRVRKAKKTSDGTLIERRRLWPGEVIILADGVELVVSGREFVFTADPAEAEPWEPGESVPTTAHHA